MDKDKKEVLEIMGGGLLAVFLGLFLILLFIAGARVLDKYTNTQESPDVVYCYKVNMVIIEEQHSIQWPAQIQKGCRCVLHYEGRTYIDVKNRSNSWCDPNGGVMHDRKAESP